MNKFDKPTEEREDIIYGRNSVIEALRAKKNAEEILIQNGNKENSLQVVLALCKENDVLVKEVDKKKLDAICNGGNHQGVVLRITPYKYFELEDIIEYAESLNEVPYILILDQIQDVHNFGALIRTAECFGVHGIVIQKRRSASVTETVYKTSAGAIEYLKIAKVSNISNTIERLKELGFWIYGGDMDGDIVDGSMNFNSKRALVIGNEGEGISRLVKKNCDKILKIPMKGKINSLNASVAGGILMYELSKYRE